MKASGGQHRPQTPAAIPEADDDHRGLVAGRTRRSSRKTP